MRSMSDLVITGRQPVAPLSEAVLAAARVLDTWECYALEDRYHFALGGGWSLALSSDSADRIRVETCRLTRPTDTMWASSSRVDRLAGLVRRMSTVPEAV